jgi:hypothetical protein
MRFYLKILKQKGLAQVVACLQSKCEAFNSKPQDHQKEKVSIQDYYKIKIDQVFKNQLSLN